MSARATSQHILRNLEQSFAGGMTTTTAALGDEVKYQQSTHSPTIEEWTASDIGAVRSARLKIDLVVVPLLGTIREFRVFSIAQYMLISRTELLSWLVSCRSLPRSYY